MVFEDMRNQPTRYSMFLSLSITRCLWSPCSSIASSFRQPPDPQCPFRTDSSSGKLVSLGESPQMTVTTRRCFRWSVRTFARCLEVGNQVGFSASGRQSQASMGRSQRSHVGGMSNGVPAKSLDMNYCGGSCGSACGSFERRYLLRTRVIVQGLMLTSPL